MVDLQAVGNLGCAWENCARKFGGLCKGKILSADSEPRFHDPSVVFCLAQAMRKWKKRFS